MFSDVYNLNLQLPNFKLSIIFLNQQALGKTGVHFRKISPVLNYKTKTVLQLIPVVPYSLIHFLPFELSLDRPTCSHHVSSFFLLLFHSLILIFVLIMFFTIINIIIITITIIASRSEYGEAGPCFLISQFVYANLFLFTNCKLL